MFHIGDSASHSEGSDNGQGTSGGTASELWIASTQSMSPLIDNNTNTNIAIGDGQSVFSQIHNSDPHWAILFDTLHTWEEGVWGDHMVPVIQHVVPLLGSDVLT